LKGIFEVKLTNSDIHLGGKDFDVVHVNHILSEFKKESGIDSGIDGMALLSAREAAENSKIEPPIFTIVPRTWYPLKNFKTQKPDLPSVPLLLSTSF
jgi:Hsp70 protein